METVKQQAKRLWTLAKASPKATVVIAIVVIAIYFLVN